MLTPPINLITAFNTADDAPGLVALRHPIRRLTGGWTRRIIGIKEKPVKNGYSYTGDFVNCAHMEVRHPPGLYLDCDQEGLREDPRKVYQLFHLDADGGATRLALTDAKDWARKFAPMIERELEAERTKSGIVMTASPPSPASSALTITPTKTSFPPRSPSTEFVDDSTQTLSVGEQRAVIEGRIQVLCAEIDQLYAELEALPEDDSAPAAFTWTATFVRR